MKTFTSLAEDLLQLFFPHLCIGCGSDNISNNDYLCAFCFQDLPLTNSAAFDNNPTERIFNGRLPIIAAHSEMYFQKGTIVQELLHQLKYKGKHEIGVFLGEMIGKSIVSSSRFNNIDMIVPLPLHKNKEKKRGYNQSVFIAKGISNITGNPTNTQAIKRIKNTQTQTKKKIDEAITEEKEDKIEETEKLKLDQELKEKPSNSDPMNQKSSIRNASLITIAIITLVFSQTNSKFRKIINKKLLTLVSFFKNKMGSFKESSMQIPQTSKESKQIKESQSDRKKIEGDEKYQSGVSVN